jgi:manganese transport protein
MSSPAPPATPHEQAHALKDPYQFHPEDIANPPTTLGAMMRKIGPGMILAASIVGSGELIATTTLGAEVGYAALWVILLSCFLKPAVQSEMGRYTIATGETGLGAFNHVPGPRLFGVAWPVWGWVYMIAMTRFQIGAMFGGVAQTLVQLFPSVPNPVWVAILIAITLWLLLGGGYERIEGLATIKVGLFTALTFLCALLLTRRSDLFSWAELSQGLKFDLPGQGIATAVAVFGITGVGAAELFMYPYWCVEKGYARFTGKRDDSPAWAARAHGWIRVMQTDILCTMFIYTVATIAFYLLGAGILAKQGLMPKGDEVIPVLSRMYTDTLGEWALIVFYIGAIATLYGTIFAATAAESRVFADLCRLLGRFEGTDYASRIRYRRMFVWSMTFLSAGLYLVFRNPVQMVKAAGVAQASMLPVIAVSTLYLRYRKLPALVRPPLWMDAGLWIASIAIFGMIGYSIISLLK